MGVDQLRSACKMTCHLCARDTLVLRARDAARTATDLLQVDLVVKDLDITAAWFVLHIGQGANFALCLKFQLLVLDLQKTTPRVFTST